MLTITHEHIRNLNPENYGWLIISTVMPDWRNPVQDFEPVGGWAKTDVPDEVRTSMRSLPMTSYRDATGTMLFTMAESDGKFLGRLDGEGWSISCDDLEYGGWEDTNY